jgi:hypothetical protein
MKLVGSRGPLGGHLRSGSVRKTLFLHVGAPKSGSTYLQTRLWANRAELRAQDIQLPGAGWVDHHRAGADLCGRQGGPARAPQLGAWERLVAQVKDDDARVAIISDERLCWATSSQVRRAMRSLAACDVHVIYGVREFAGVLTSAWQQGVKMTSANTLGEWLTRVAGGDYRWFWKGHHLGSVLTRWNLPSDRVSFLIVPPTPAEPEELWRRFASIVAAPLDLPRQALGGNQTLGIDETELVRRMYGYVTDGPASFPTKRVMRQVVSGQVLASRHNVRRIQLPEACRAFVAHHTARRKQIVASSGCRIVGDTGELDLDPTRFVPELDRPDDVRVLDAAIDVIVELSKRMARRPLGDESLLRVSTPPARTVIDKTQAEVVRRVHQRLEGLGPRDVLANAINETDLDHRATSPARTRRTPSEAAVLDTAVRIAARLVEQLAARRARTGQADSEATRSG